MFDKLNFDIKFLKFLENTRSICRISELMRYDNGSFLKNIGSYIKIENDEIDVVSYIPKSKLIFTKSGFDDEKNRVKIKIGRFVNKIFKKEIFENHFIQLKDVESFVNIFKSYLSIDPNSFKIVSGDEIYKWYLQNNYYSPNGYACGSLWNSCMRHFERNRFMLLYAINPDKVKMLINVEDGKLRSRALLWEECTNRNGETFKVMDRIYYTYDHEVEAFKKWAIDNGYCHKLDQSSRSERLFFNGTSIVKMDLTVKLDNHKIDYYPYLDTFKFYNPKTGNFSNSDNFNFQYVLVQSNGDVVPPPREEPVVDEDDFMEVDDGF